MLNVTLHVRNAALERVARIEDFSVASLVPRFNDLGSWMIQGIPLASEVGNALVPGAGIVALLGDQVLMSGPMLFPEITFGPTGYMLNASGCDDMIAAYSRVIYPDPTTYPDGSGQWSVYSDDRSGPAETVMKEYVEANAGPSALSGRRYQGLIVAPDTALGDSVTYTARLTALGDAMNQLALSGGGLRYYVVQDEDDLVFHVAEPTDRTGTVKFNPTLGNVRTLRYGRKMGSTNSVLVGGGGDATARVFQIVQDSASQAQWGITLETFKDQRQTSDLTELQQAGAEELYNHSDQDGVEIEPIDTAALTFGTDYDLGDLVSVVINGLPITEAIREVRIDQTREGQRVIPVVGTPGVIETATSERRILDLLFQRQRQLARRLGVLEVAQ